MTIHWERRLERVPRYQDAWGNSSDHFPVWIQYQDDPVLGSRPQRWNFNKADWADFQSSLETTVLARAEASTMTAEDFTSLVLT